MPFKKGMNKTGGRKRGTSNKFTNLKEAFINAFNNIGGEEALTDFANIKRNQQSFFQMLSKMLPTNVKTDIDGELKITIEKKITNENPNNNND